MNTRTGKIARLPTALRLELNERLDQGEEGPELLDWLNALPEVQELLQEKFAGVPISKQNLSEWRQGGFQEWLLRRDLCAAAHRVADAAEEMDADSPRREVIDGVAMVLATRFGGLLLHWNGEVDEKTEAQAKFLNAMCRSVVRLQRSTHRAKKDRVEEERLTLEQEVRAQDRTKKCYSDMLLAPMQAEALSARYAGTEFAPIFKDAWMRVLCGLPPELSKARDNLMKTRQAAVPKNETVPKPKQPEAAATPAPTPAESPSVKPNQTIFEPADDPDTVEVQRLMQLDAKGDGHSAYCLGARFRDGVGVPKDLQKADEYLERAASRGIGPARIALHALRSRLVAS